MDDTRSLDSGPTLGSDPEPFQLSQSRISTPLRSWQPNMNLIWKTSSPKCEGACSQKSATLGWPDVAGYLDFEGDAQFQHAGFVFE